MSMPPDGELVWVSLLPNGRWWCIGQRENGRWWVPGTPQKWHNRVHAWRPFS